MQRTMKAAGKVSIPWLAAMAGILLAGCTHKSKALQAAHKLSSPTAARPAAGAAHELAGISPTEALNSGREPMTAADVGFFLRVMRIAVAQAEHPSAQQAGAVAAGQGAQRAYQQQSKTQAAAMQALGRKAAAALKAGDMAAYAAAIRQMGALQNSALPTETRQLSSLKTGVQTLQFAAHQARAWGMPGEQWAALKLRVIEVARQLSIWKMGAALARETGQPLRPFCPAQQDATLSSHDRLTSHDFALAHAACLGDQHAVEPHLGEIKRLVNAYSRAVQRLNPSSPATPIE